MEGKKPEKNPFSEKFIYKDKFIERYSKLTDWNAFIDICGCYLRKSIRVNTLKISIEDLKKRLEDKWCLEQIPWCKEGFWIEHKGEKRIDIGNLREHALGYIYVQEAASMIPPVVLEPKPGEIILDMCAAPGSKTTQIAQYMENKGIVVANDIKADRLSSLGINVQRCGLMNVVITKSFGYHLKKPNKEGYDRILIDAPCSGTGSIRKSLKTIEMWNPLMVKKLANLQKRLIERGFNLLKDNGLMVYSTCTLEPEENEGVVSYLLDRYKNAKLEEIKINIKRSPAIMEFEGEKYNKGVEKCLRIWPQDNDTEGFFIAKIKKIAY
ncbi:MAG: RsmB/NOP family class I SAM-dependent RNA methyltransferase [Candidatus Woesearchaeota archaeon]|nr:RsmB/NOP family class I SAM-dependent RNA methyltransferase [Candidatus Woesearchaeota archaeon]